MVSATNPTSTPTRAVTSSPTTIGMRYDSRKLCDAQQQIQGSVPVAELANLCTYLAVDEGVVEVNVAFARDESKQAILSGVATARDVKIVCQRCMEIASFDISCDLHMAIVTTAAAEKLPSDYDAWVAEEGQVKLREILDQELILSLPIVPAHMHCKVQMEYGDRETASERVNPFGALAALVEKD